MNNIRKSTARACPIHAALKERAEDGLLKHGCYSHQKLLDDAKFALNSDDIRWDYIRDFIEEDHAIKLIPVVQRFFRKHAAQEVAINPQKYLAHGRGKSAAGFASVSQENGFLARCHMTRRIRMAEGAQYAASALKQEVDKRVPLELPPVQMNLLAS